MADESTTTKTTSSPKPPADDAGQAEIQANFDKIGEQGVFGTPIDPTPNENYTVAGVTSGAPTPETDKAAADAALAATQGPITDKP